MATFAETIDDSTWQLLTQIPSIVSNKSSYPLKINVGNALPELPTKNFFTLSAGEFIYLDLAADQSIFVLASEGKVITVVYADSTIVFTDALLQEDGFLLLQENGSKILIETEI